MFFPRPHRYPAILFFLATLTLCVATDGPAQEKLPAEAKHAPKKSAEPSANDEATQAISRFQLAPGLKCELWAAEPLLANPVSFTFDEKGRCYVCETFRQQHGVVDNRDHMFWLDDDLAARTVDDRLAYFKKHLKDKIADYTKFDDRISLLEDTKGLGRADKSTVFAAGFNGPLDGTGAGVLTRGGDIYYTCIPDLWRLRDKNGDGVISKDVPGERTSLHHGYGVHVAFRGHDLHGLTWGPDGKLYFTCGDRGLNVKSRDAAGKEYAVTLPDTGAVLRCNPDGSELELFATGLRNPQELAFDAYGNLFTCDNNSDSGDKARWLYLVEGGDYGWRMHYQYLPDRGPWNRERIWQPASADHPAYVIPPVANFADGPSGLAYYPGTGLSEKYNGTFLLCDFRGGAANSGVRTVKLKPKGAGFEIAEDGRFIWGILATDVEFGPDGAVYVSDWVNGWNGTGKGRIYRIRSAAQEKDDQSDIRTLLRSKPVNFEETVWFNHPDLRVRLRAQELLAHDGKTAIKSFRVRQANIHNIWSLAPTFKDEDVARHANAMLFEAVEHENAEIRAQAAKVLGDRHVKQARDALIKALKDASPRVRFFTAISLGKCGDFMAITPLLEMLEENADKDPYLRHAGVMGLAGIGASGPNELRPIIGWSNDTVISRSRRLGVLLALRRLKQPAVATYLHDAEPALITEAARAIHDELIEPAMPELAKLTTQVGLPNAAIHRALNANFRLGAAEHAEAVAALGANPRAAEAMRVEAIEMLIHWAKPSGRDRVLGSWRPIVGRSDTPSYETIALAAAKKHLAGFFAGPEKVRQAAARLAIDLKLGDAGPMLLAMAVDAKSPPASRADALSALTSLKDARLGEAIKQTLNDPSDDVRAAAQRSLAVQDPPTAVEVFRKVLHPVGRSVTPSEKSPKATEKKETTKPPDGRSDTPSYGSRAERQAAFASLGKMNLPAAEAMLAGSLDQLLSGKLAADVQLDLLLAAEVRSKANNKAVEIKQRLDKFNAARPKSDALAAYRETLEGGNATRGRAVFFDRVDLSCRRCHKINDSGGNVGPDLSHVAKDKTREYLLESIVLPDKILAQGFQAVMVQTDDGRTVSGIVKSEDDKQLTLQTAEGNFVTIPKASIEQRGRGRSPMPDDVIKQLSKPDLRDLVEYLSTLK